MGCRPSTNHGAKCLPFTVMFGPTECCCAPPPGAKSKCSTNLNTACGCREISTPPVIVAWAFGCCSMCHLHSICHRHATVDREVAIVRMPDAALPTTTANTKCHTAMTLPLHPAGRRTVERSANFLRLRSNNRSLSIERKTALCCCRWNTNTTCPAIASRGPTKIRTNSSR